MVQLHDEKDDNGAVETLAERIIHAARTGDYATTASQLNRFLAMLQKQLAIGTISAEKLNNISYSLETLSQMQQMANWVAFADLLEYEFLPLWKT